MLVVCERYRTERKRWTVPVRGGFGRVRAGQDLNLFPASHQLMGVILNITEPNFRSSGLKKGLSGNINNGLG